MGYLFSVYLGKEMGQKDKTKIYLSSWGQYPHAKPAGKMAARRERNKFLVTGWKQQVWQ